MEAREDDASSYYVPEPAASELGRRRQKGELDDLKRSAAAEKLRHEAEAEVLAAEKVLYTLKLKRAALGAPVHSTQFISGWLIQGPRPLLHPLQWIKHQMKG